MPQAMPESFDPWLYLDHLRRRGQLIGLACAVALAVSLSGSLLMTKKYTATSRIVIEPPAGSDLRAAMTVSPIYLESLKTYELLAASDDLFYQAAEHFHLRDRNHPNAIDRLKRSVLKVTIPRNTKVLEISATLAEPQKAHTLALYLAEETVKLNRRIAVEGDRELVAEAGKRLAEAQGRLQETQSAWNEIIQREPVDRLGPQIEALERLQAELERRLSLEQLIMAETAEREKADADGTQSDLRLSQARIKQLRGQLDELKGAAAAKHKLMQERIARRGAAETRLKTARADFDAAENHLREVRSAAGFRGERLKIIDPGIVPERPSSPNIPVNVMAACLIALVASLVYVTLEFSYRLRKPAAVRPALRVAAKGRED